MSDWTIPVSEVLLKYQTSLHGLSAAEAEKRLKQYGLNEIKKEGARTVLGIALSQFQNPLIIILLVVVGVSFFTSEMTNGIVILVMLSINAVLGFVQEYKAHKSLEKLRKMISISSKVYREGKVFQLESEQLVPGDIVQLNKGDLVPADIRLLSAESLEINEAVLTGESVDVEKRADDSVLMRKWQVHSQPQEIKNSVFQGTSVSAGSAKGVVIATGKATFLGRSVDMSKNNDPKTHFVEKMAQFTRMIFYVVLVIVTVVMVINIALGRSVISSMVLGITLALGITPETMPIILSIALSNAAYKLSRKNVLIKRITAFEDLGNINVICSDKTGTITTGQLKLKSALDEDFEESARVMEYALICNASNPSVNFAIASNKVDDTIWSSTMGVNIKPSISSEKILKTWDFSFENRMMGVASERKLIVKGAYESVIKRSSNLHDKKRLLEKIKTFEKLGYRIIAVAVKSIDGANGRTVDGALEGKGATVAGQLKALKSLNKVSGLKYQGLLLLEDPPRDTIAHQISSLRSLNVDLKIITGDSADIAREVCEKVGFWHGNENENGKGNGTKNDGAVSVVTGEELEAAGYPVALCNYDVFARVSPEQKHKIIEVFKTAGNVVGYIGDGINDVGALEVADVGIAVDSATDVAKDSADIVILNHDLETVITGITEGRKVFINTMKFIFSTMSSSFGNVLTIVIASAILKFIPLLPSQILLLDSLSDFQHLAISTDNVDPELLKRPEDWNMRLFAKYSVIWGIISAVFDFFHFGVILALSSSPEVFRTTWILESITTEIVATISLRTPRRVWQSMPSILLMVFSVLPIGIFLVLAYSPLGDKWFDMVPLSGMMLLAVVGIVAVYFVGLEIAKKYYYREFWKIDRK